MEKRNIQFNKKRELPEIITDSFAFLKQEIGPISRLIVVYVLPFIVLYAAAQIYFQRNILSEFNFGDPEKMASNISPIYRHAFLFLLFGIFIQSLLAGTYYTYLEAYFRKGRGNIDISEISPYFFTHSLFALVTGLVFAALSFLGAMFFIIPGIYLANTLSLAVFISILEKNGLNFALAKSWKLVHTNWWNTLVINVIGLLIIFGVKLVLSIPVMSLDVSQGLASETLNTSANYPQWYWILTGATSVISSIALIVPYTFLAFQYFNLEERINPELPTNNQ